MSDLRLRLIDHEGCETQHQILQRPVVRDGLVFFVEATGVHTVREWVVPLAAVRAVAWERPAPEED